MAINRNNFMTAFIAALPRLNRTADQAINASERSRNPAGFSIVKALPRPSTSALKEEAIHSRVHL